MEENISEIIKLRKEKLNSLKENGIEPYAYVWDKKDDLKTIREKFAHLKDEEESDYIAITAGRIISRRRQGKVGFCDITDHEDRIQLYFRYDILQDAYELFKKLDIGDFIGVEGNVFKTRSGELTIFVKGYQILTKAIRPLPEKWHGLKDIELRYRKRYLDLIANKDVFNIFLLRSRIIQKIREYLHENAFIEVETPILQVQAGGADARPFITKHNALGCDLYLRIAPELYLKRLLVGGFERVFELNRSFRNEGIDRDHNPEFTMLEAYAAYWDYEDVMKFTENIIKYIIDEIFGGNLAIKTDNGEYPIKFPFKRISMTESLKEKGIDVMKMSEEELLKRLNEIGKEKTFSRGKAIEKLFEHHVSSELNEAAFVIDFPVESSPLTKGHRTVKGLVERFELYLGGIEVANAFSELNDPQEQRERFLMQETHRAKGDEEAQGLDEDYIEALEYGMPPAGGLGLGIDRLIMTLTGARSIKDIILFPAMKRG